LLSKYHEIIVRPEQSRAARHDLSALTLTYLKALTTSAASL